jgi:hypothetical protein
LLLVLLLLLLLLLLPGMPDIGGYNFDITRQPSSAAIGLGSTAAHAGTAANGVTAANSSVTSASTAAAATAAAASASPTPASPAASGRRMLLQLDQAEALLESGSDVHAAAAAAATTLDTIKSAGKPQEQQQQQRHLQQLVENAAEDVLDSFRRGTPRGACAHSAAYGWSMASVDGEGVDVAAYRRMVAGHDMGGHLGRGNTLAAQLSNAVAAAAAVLRMCGVVWCSLTCASSAERRTFVC